MIHFFFDKIHNDIILIYHIYYIRTNLDPIFLGTSLNSTNKRGNHTNMTTIIINFFTIIALLANSFQENIIQRLHKIYKHYGYVYSMKDTDQGESDCCAVCLNQMCKGEKVRSLSLCNHRYHADCIGAWMKNHTTCPLCRTKITEHTPQNQQKEVKPFRESMFGLMQSFSDVFVAVLYMILPSSITQSFPLVH